MMMMMIPRFTKYKIQVHYLVHAYAHKSILDVPMDTFQNAVNWKYLYLDEPELPKKLFMLPDPGFYDRSSCFQENPAYIEKQRKANNDVKALRYERRPLWRDEGQHFSVTVTAYCSLSGV